MDDADDADAGRDASPDRHPERREKATPYALVAGVAFYALAFAVLCAIPWILTDQNEPYVVGEDGVRREVLPYTERQANGRRVYGEQVCWHCHMQFIRPVFDEDVRWGPVSRSGEFAHDVPHFFGTRRIGPDLSREGQMRVDDWHIAHLWDPRTVVKGSVMPAFPWLFREQRGADRMRHLIARLDTNGDGIVSLKLGDDTSSPTPEIASLREQAASPEFDRWGVDSVRRVGDPGGDPLRGITRWRWEPAGDGLLTDHDARPLPTQDGYDVVAYLQRLGTTIGPWRRPVHSGAPARRSPFVGDDGTSLEPPRRPAATRVFGFHLDDPAKVKAAQEALADWERRRADWAAKNPLLSNRLARGKELYDQHCASCHGDEGRGNGIGAPHLQTRPRDFTLGKYKYRSTLVGKLPLDGDLYRSIHRGLPGTAMPSWRELPEERIWLIVDYVKSLYEGSLQFDDQAESVAVPPEWKGPDLKKHLARGRAIYFSSAAACYNCHGEKGEADGPGWNTTAGDYGGTVRPRDLPPRFGGDQPELRLRGGATAQDLWRTIMTGIDGTPMVAQFATFFEEKPADAAAFPGISRKHRPLRVSSRPGDRLKLSIPLGDPSLYDVGVVKEGEDEFITLREGDDWALVHYVMSLMDLPILRPESE